VPAVDDECQARREPRPLEIVRCLGCSQRSLERDCCSEALPPVVRFPSDGGALLTSSTRPLGITTSVPLDTHFGGSVDLVDYVGGRAGVLIDFQAVLGSEYRPFDPNQGNYTLEAFASARRGSTEIVGCSITCRGISADRPKRDGHSRGTSWAGACCITRRSGDDSSTRSRRRARGAAFVRRLHLARRVTCSFPTLGDHVGRVRSRHGLLYARRRAVAHRGTQPGG